MRMQRQFGFSLVEILVAMVVALLGTVVIFQVFELSEGIKRTSTSGGDAQQFGAIALFTLERDLRMAGYGINNDNLAGCKTNYSDNSPANSDLDAILGTELSTASTSLTLVPVEIVPGANDATPDEIRVFYGNSDLLSTPAKITSNQASATTDEVRIANPFGFVPGNVIVIAEPGRDCAMAQVTEVATESLFYRLGNYTNAVGASVPSRFNNSVILPSPNGYSTNGTVFNLGNAPVRNIYRVANNQLVLQSVFGTTGSVAIADNILLLKAQYGKDTNNDGSVDTYNTTTPAANEWIRILTVRLAVLARSAQPEIPSSGVKTDACDATTVAPSWSGGNFDLSGDPDWQCYRYRVFETTVPLRNMIWQQT